MFRPALRALALALLFVTIASSSFAHQGEFAARPDAHAPIGIMGDHVHAQGNWMASYRYMGMFMKGLRDGTQDVSSQDAFDAGYAVAPTEMSMHMHMVGLMFAPSNRMTLMLMGSYLAKEMDHLTRPGSPARTNMGETFLKNIDGFGDVTLSALVPVWNAPGSRVHVNLGVSLPTGSIDEEDPEQLAYPMQTGTGTWDLKPGLTYMGYNRVLSWGGQAMGMVCLGENDAGYTFGNTADVSGWLALKAADWASVSGRVRYQAVEGIDGSDPRVAARMAPPQDPANSGGQFVEAGLGMNFKMTEGFLAGQRFAVEVVVPVAMDVTGIQHKRNWSVTAGVQRGW